MSSRKKANKTSAQRFVTSADARVAIRREPENWRGPLVLSRVEARLGHARAAVAAFRRARALNPHHPIFAP